MAYKSCTLFSLIEDINKRVFLPHIQRPFVWQMDQMVRLFDSLMRNYPIQTFLFWRTKEYIKARKFLQAIDWDAELSKLYDPQVSKEGVGPRSRNVPRTKSRCSAAATWTSTRSSS